MLVTDLWNFSPLVTTLGDRRARQLIQAHNELLRSCLRENNGREVTHTGDGIIASFINAHSAARCAMQMQSGLHAYRALIPKTPMCARMGIHAGRPLPEEGRLFGASVNFAVRVCGVAQPNEILVSDCVQKLLAESFDCVERNPVPLKGFEGTYRLHALHWQPEMRYTH